MVNDRMSINCESEKLITAVFIGLTLTIFQWRLGSPTERKFEKNFHKRSKYSAVVTNLKKNYVWLQIKGLKAYGFLAQNYYLFWSYRGG